MVKFYAFIGCIYTKLIFGIIQLILFLNIKNTLKFSFPDDYNIEMLLWLLWIIIFLIFAVLNAIDIIKCFLNNDIEKIQKYVYKIKLLLIPYWILSFISSLVFWGVITVVSRGFLSFLLPIPFIFAFLIFSITSIYSILFILKIWKYEKIKDIEFVLYLFSQFIFVLDIIGIILLKNKIRNRL